MPQDTIITKLYQDYPNQPYVNPDRDLVQFAQDLSTGREQKVSRQQMVSTEEGLLPGHIILLWRIAFGTFTNQSVFPKYLEYTYGIDGSAGLELLIDQGYAYLETPSQSIDHLNAGQVKAILKDLGVRGYSKLNRQGLDSLLLKSIDDDDLGSYFKVQGLALSSKGQAALSNNQAIIDKHPKKKY